MKKSALALFLLPLLAGTAFSQTGVQITRVGTSCRVSTMEAKARFDPVTRILNIRTAMPPSLPNTIVHGTMYFFGTTATQVDLTLLGYPGCFLYTLPDIASGLLPPGPNPQYIDLDLPIPNDPFLVGASASYQSMPVHFVTISMSFDFYFTNGLTFTIV